MDKFFIIYKKLLKNNEGNSLIDIIENILNEIEKDKNKKYIRNIKFTNKEYICEIISVLSNNISWRKHIGKIDGRVLNNKHNYFVKIGLYEKLYEYNLEKYLKNNKKESKILSMDSTFIQNKNGIEKIGRNVFYKNKKGIKITTIVDNKGIPLKMRIDEGNRHDAILAPKIINNMVPNKKNIKKYILADKGYDSQKIRNLINKKKYIPLISKRKNNYKAKILSNKEKKIYHNRIIVENSYSWIKSFAKVEKFYEKKIKSYKGLLLLAVSILIFKRC